MKPPWFSRMRRIHTFLVRVIFTAVHFIRRIEKQLADMNSCKWCRLKGFELGEGVRDGVTIWISAGDDERGACFWFGNGDLKTVSSETAQWAALCSEHAIMAILSEEKLENESIPSRMIEPICLMGYRGKSRGDVAEKIKLIQGDDNIEWEKTHEYISIDVQILGSIRATTIGSKGGADDGMEIPDDGVIVRQFCGDPGLGCVRSLEGRGTSNGGRRMLSLKFEGRQRKDVVRRLNSVEFEEQ
ncbi:hypothetical protein K503DRAFT_784229 [Rhizopogon vinicolor AM-OR11-026]|uniref:Uncharacterized protein n=1 Tax=Rhizopogon vinicolor AM-OR11-026 TaxID=1314800 RepID=A0A1B7MVE3_9AGAM|nr:hypothetical protein K503DRAFT_784229 [Rhizopogon vinicolor AM-OR11-026]